MFTRTINWLNFFFYATSYSTIYHFRRAIYERTRINLAVHSNHKFFKASSGETNDCYSRFRLLSSYHNVSPNTKSSYILSTECSTCWPTWEICSRRPLVLCYNSHSIVRFLVRSCISILIFRIDSRLLAYTRIRPFYREARRETDLCSKWNKLSREIRSMASRQCRQTFLKKDARECRCWVLLNKLFSEILLHFLV